MRRTVAVIAITSAAAFYGSVTATSTDAAQAAPAKSATRVLRVGSYHGIRGQYKTLQAAVNAAKPHDWILVGPGDYKTRTTKRPKGGREEPAGVLVTTRRITIRGMNRNHVIVDGTKSGPPCSTRTKDQVFGPKSSDGRLGRNGIEVWKTNHVSVENLTVCNFLGGHGDAGNEIWWNGGDDSGKLGGYGFHGDYMTATSTYYRNETSAAEYGIFSSNWVGGDWNHSYASNFNDSGLYIGACRQSCNQKVDHIWAEYNALGYSGSNSGGSLIVEHSEFDNNEDGFDTNSQNGDNPPPQNGDCPHGKISPVTHTRSCWVFIHNYVHDNNNPNVPTAGSAAAGPVGTGISISGGRNDTIMDNRFVHNKAWGTIFVPYPDSGPPCTGGTQTQAACLYDEYGDALLHNSYKANGGYGNPTNGDFGATNLEADPTDCYHGNHKAGGGAPTSSPSDAQSTYPKCTGQTVPPDTNSQFLAEVACDSGNVSLAAFVSGGSACKPTDHYPRQTKVVMHALPGAHRSGRRPALENPASAHLATMRHPCRGVPANPWCPKHGGSHATRAARSTVELASHGFILAGTQPAMVKPDVFLVDRRRLN